MFGFVIGFACLWGLIRVVRGRRGHGPWGRHHGRNFRGRGCGGGRSWGGGGWGGGGWSRRDGGWSGDGSWDGPPEDDFEHRGGGRRGGANMVMRGLFNRLDTTPGQEKEIRASVEEVITAGHALKDDVKGSRKEVAEAFRGDDFNAELMASLLTRHDDAIDGLRQAMVANLARVHATLEPDQRRQLARMLERGPGFGPYRGTYA